MKHQVYFGIALRIIFLFLIGMLFTYIPDHLRGFFGDTLKPIEAFSFNSDFIDPNYEWGIRHYWYFWLMNILFALSVINVIVSVRSLILKYYPEFQIHI